MEEKIGENEEGRELGVGWGEREIPIFHSEDTTRYSEVGLSETLVQKTILEEPLLMLSHQATRGPLRPSMTP